LPATEPLNAAGARNYALSAYFADHPMSTAGLGSPATAASVISPASHIGINPFHTVLLGTR
jgi:hypothetical protein